MKLRAFSATIAIALAAPAAADDHSTTYHSVPSDADFTAAKAVTDEVMKLIEAGEFNAAIDKIQESSPLLRDKQEDMDVVVSQAQAGVQFYGPIAKCILSTHTHASALRMSFNYICQHENLLLQWSLQADRLPRGWSITNVKFTDSF